MESNKRKDTDEKSNEQREVKRIRNHKNFVAHIPPTNDLELIGVNIGNDENLINNQTTTTTTTSTQNTEELDEDGEDDEDVVEFLLKEINGNMKIVGAKSNDYINFRKTLNLIHHSNNLSNKEPILCEWNVNACGYLNPTKIQLFKYSEYWEEDGETE